MGYRFLWLTAIVTGNTTEVDRFDIFRLLL